MSKLKIVTLVSAFTFSLGIAHAGMKRINQKSVDLVELIKNSKKYDRKSVETIGIINLEFESHTLSVLSCKSSVAAKIGTAVWISVPPALNNKPLNGTKVKVRGIFDVGNKGHFDQYPGTLKVEKFEVLDSSNKDGC